MAYPFRHRFRDQLDLLDVVDAEDAVSTIGAVSSPPRAMEDENWSEISSPVAFRDAPFQEDDESSMDKTWKPRRKPAQTDAEKALHVLDFMQEFFKSHFSLRNFIDTLFTSDHPELRASIGMFLSGGGLIPLLNAL